jgi:hypothetical protein
VVDFLFDLLAQAVGFGIGIIRTLEDTSGYQPEELGRPLRNIPSLSYGIVLSKETEWDAERTLRFVTQIRALGRCLFQVDAIGDTIQFFVTFLDDVEESTALSAISSYYPEAIVESYAYSPSKDKKLPFVRASIFLKPDAMFAAPLFPVEMVKHFDPLATLTQAMSQLRTWERILFTIAVLDEAIGAPEVGNRLITTSDIHPFAYTDLNGIIIAEARKSKGFDRIPKFVGNIQNVLEEKLQHPLFHCLITLQTEAPIKERAITLLKVVAPHMDLFAYPPFNMLTIPPLRPEQEAVIDIQTIREEKYLLMSDIAFLLYIWMNPEEANTPEEDRDMWKSFFSVLMPQEIATLWHLPDSGFTSPAISWITSKKIPAPKAVRDITMGTFLGNNRFGQTERAIYLPSDDRTSHTLVIGKTGTGKSSLLHHMIHTDIQQGRGVCVIDPHGRLVQHLLRTSIPKNRQADVVVLDIAQAERNPPPFNLLSKPAGVAQDVAVGMVMGVLTKIYSDFAETQMAYTLTMALHTLAYADQPTLLDVLRLFEEPDFRDPLLAKVENLSVKRFWNSFLNKSYSQQEQMTFPMLRRLDGFSNNNLLLSMTCHPDPIPLTQWLHDNKIILISLAVDEARVPPLERQLLGATLVSQIQMAAMSGAIQHPPFLFYVDEAQQFVTTALSTMLSEARKSGLGLVLANQYMNQLSGETLDAVAGNVGTFLLFEMGEVDARTAAIYTKPEFVATDLVALGKFHAAVSMRVNGSRQSAFSLDTLPPPQENKQSSELEAFLRQQSIARYTPKPYSEIIGWIHQRYAPTPPTTSSGTKNGSQDDFIEPKP